MDKNILGLSNFYSDRVPKDRDYNKLALLYENLYKMITSYAKSVGNNAVIPMIETYKKIPAFNFDPTPGQYNINEILSRPDVASKLGSNIMTETTASRISKWEGLGLVKYTSSEKIAILDYLGLYCNVYGYDQGMTTTYKIVDANLLGYNFERFSKGIDYIFKDNRLYLFNEAAIYSSKAKYFVLEDIFVDKMNAERRLGIYVGLEQPQNMTRNEYRELIQLIYYVVTMGPTIKNIETAIRSITGLEEAKVLDRYTEDRSRLQYWTDTTRGDRLKDFDFLISIPEMESHDIEKLMNFINYVKLIKPSDTDFIFARAITMYDVFHMTKKDSKTRFLARSYVLDRINHIDTMYFEQKAAWIERLTATETFSVSKVSGFFEDKINADDYLLNIPITIRPNNFIVTDLGSLYNDIRQGNYPTDKISYNDTQKEKSELKLIDHNEYQGQMNKFKFDYSHATGEYLRYDSPNIAWDGEDGIHDSDSSYRDFIEVRLIKK